MVTVTGSLAFDHIMDFQGKFADHIMPDKIHKLNLSFYLETLKKQNGGTAGNISYNLSLLKTPVAILGIAGKDFTEYSNFLKTSGIDVSSIRILSDELTASAFIMTDKEDNQISGFYPGAIKKADTLSLKDLDYKPSFVIISPDNPLAMVKFVSECQELNIPYMFDPGMQLPSLSDEQLKNGISGAEILIGNDYEMELMKKRIKDNGLFGKIKVLITTLGEKGSIIEANGETFQIKAGKVSVAVDPTGAGDAYRGGFMAGYLQKQDLKTCGQMGSIAACFTVEKYGTISHTFTIEEFRERYKENFGEALRLSL